MALSRPDVWMGIALNRDANDPNVPAVWTSLQSADLQVRSSTGQKRGRDYELAQPLASDPVNTIRDINEYLNPDNPSSPYAGQVVPYREIAALAQWPVTATGGNNNLINSGTWRGSRVDSVDPSFESYTTGAAAPNWINRRSLLAAPTITTSNPFEGTKSLTFACGTSGPGQGIRYGVPVIPGRQYTSSAYVRQSAANTMAIMVEGITAVYDTFGRTVVNGTGNPDASWNGTTYAIAGGTGSPADYDVANGQLLITNTTTDAPRAAVIGSFFDSEQTITVTAPALAAGNRYVEGVTSRYVDASNNYKALVRFDTDGSMGLAIERRLASVAVFIVELDLPLIYSPGDQFVLHFSTQGGTLFAWCWPRGRKESKIYSAGPITDTSAALQVAAPIGPVSYRYGGNTNASLASGFSAYSATGSVVGTTTAATGAYNRLSVTYTADQIGRPALIDAIESGLDNARGLCIKIVTMNGATVASTVNVDAIQHEQGAAATTFSASGPVIYPLFRNFAERYPRTWISGGAEGVVAIPSVDALALLNKIQIHNEADQAILGTQPDYFWTLGGGSETLVFPDASGNSGPPLTPVVSKYGAGTAPQPGTEMGITGDPSGTGVTFTPTDIFAQTTAPGTLLGTGRAGGAPSSGGVAIPVVGGIPWSATIACWVKLAARTPFDADPIRAMSRQRVFVLRAGTTSVQGFFAISKTAPPGLAEVPGHIWDGKLHLVALSVVQDATDTTLTLWVDQTSDVGTFATSALGGIATSVMDSFAVGGSMSDYSGAYQSPIDGAVTKAAAWNRALSNGEIQEIYSAGVSGFGGELSGTRVRRHIQNGPYNGPTRTAAGSAVMDPPSFDGSIDLLTDTLNTMQAEQGMAWVQPDGVIAFEGRRERWARLTSRFTFGESAATGELPYLDGLIFDNDPTYVFPVVTWTRNRGATALGGLPADRLAAAARSFPRQFDGANDLATDAAAQDLANWIFYTHRAPNTRVYSLAINPWTAEGTGISMWAKALSLEVGQRVTAVRRAKSANGGAGLTISLPMFIEWISTPEMNFVQGQEAWTLELQLSPIGSAPSGPSAQPWILENSTYGVLDATTVLGF